MEAVGGGGGVLVSHNCFLQQNTTASLLELRFSDSANYVRARRRRQWQSTKRGRRWGRWADRADIVSIDTVSLGQGCDRVRATSSV